MRILGSAGLWILTTGLLAGAFSNGTALADQCRPGIVGAVDTPGSALDVELVGSLAYVADGTSGGLAIIDVTDPYEPTVLGSHESPGGGRSLAVFGNYVYLADGPNGVQIFDASDPEDLAIVGTFSTFDYARQLCLSDSMLLVTEAFPGTSWRGVELFDISTPVSPELLGRVETPGFANSIAISGSYAYVADGSLHMIELVDPKNPTIVATLELSGSATDVAIQGDRAFVANYDTGVEIVRIGDPQFFEVVHSVPIGFPFTVSVHEDRGFVGSYDDVLFILDISDPDNADRIDVVDFPGLAFGMACSGSFLHTAGGAVGVRVVDLCSPTSSAGSVTSSRVRNTLDVSPNPAAQRVRMSLADGRWAGPLELFDVDGRRVATHQPPLGTSLSASWDLSSIPPGFYWVRGATDRGTATGALRLLR